ncbi:MAG: AlpA family phage regulatory protein [Burkholderiales bacterium]|nr:AlpA family phage regulatory protein [Burkholderiales bacterium]
MTAATTTASRTAEVLNNFDRLPDVARVRVPVVAALFGISEPTAWRWSREGKLPQPARHGARMTTWGVGALRRALAELAAG